MNTKFDWWSVREEVDGQFVRKGSFSSESRAREAAYRFLNESPLMRFQIVRVTEEPYSIISNDPIPPQSR